MKRMSSLLLTVIIASIFVGTAVAEENSSLCKKLFELDARRTKHPDDKKLANFVVHGVGVGTGSDSYPGLDIDGDGKEDTVTRNCGSGTGMLCTLSLEFSSGGYAESDESGPFYLARFKDIIYMIQTIDGQSSPYTNISSTTIFALKDKNIQTICEKHSNPLN